MADKHAKIAKRCKLTRLGHFFSVYIEIFAHEIWANVILNADVVTFQYEIDHFLLRSDQYTVRDFVLLPPMLSIVPEDVESVLLDCVSFYPAFCFQTIDSHTPPSFT